MTRGASLRHGPFGRLWLGDAVSMFGDWFTYVAVGTLALSTGSGLLAVAVVLVAHTLPRALLAPLAGRLADRRDRRAILVVVSLLRAAVVLAMIAAASAGAIAALQALLFVRMALGAFIDPAASAALPQLVRTGQLAPANALLGATYSTIFALGVAAGGVATAWLGPEGALAIDAASFVIAAAIFRGLPRLRPGDAHVPDQGPRAHSAGPDDAGRDHGDLADGWRLAWRERPILQAALAKLPVAIASGGAWISLHALAGGLADTALALGAFHAARALGTGLGPLLWARVPALRGSVAGLHAGTAATFIGVGGFALAREPGALLLASALWGLGVGACWVTATTRIQALTPNHLLGRVAAIDLMGHTLGQCLGGLVGALVADRLQSSGAAGWLGLVAGVAAWSTLQALVGRRRAGAVAVSLMLACGAATGARVAPPTSAPTSSVRPAALADPALPDPLDARAAVLAAERDPTSPPPTSAVALLATRAVHHDDFARARLYTWTTAEQAAALRASRRLLVADAATGGLPSPFNLALAEQARRGGPGHELAARLLTDPTLRRRRYAWTAPFATTLGLGPRRYGDVLVQVDLDPDALIGAFTPAAAEPFAFVDLRGRPVALAAVLADPGRLAAIYHVRDGPADAVAFREYVVINESRVATWSLATTQIQATIDAEIAMLAALRADAFSMLPEPALRTSAAPAWAGARPHPSPLDRWHASLAFDTKAYRPSPGNLAKIAAALRQYDGRGDPLVVRPHGQQVAQTAR